MQGLQLGMMRMRVPGGELMSREFKGASCNVQGALRRVEDERREDAIQARLPRLAVDVGGAVSGKCCSDWIALDLHEWRSFCTETLVTYVCEQQMLFASSISDIETLTIFRETWANTGLTCRILCPLAFFRSCCELGFCPCREMRDMLGA